LTAYYNENDPHVAQWLRNLIAAGHIAPGDVDDRSIADVRADELGQYTQHHFFAGIAGWSLALRLAGWPDDRPVWTGSCPCQPFSAAGKGKAADDERHLWPRWFSLIRECRPAIIFGEQVEAAIGWGWLDAVFTDLEAEKYSCGAAVLPACGVGAPHIRQRIFFHANALREGCSLLGGGARSAAETNTGRKPCERYREITRFPTANLPRSAQEWIVDGVSRNVGAVRAYGNAIVPQVAAAFIRAFIF
jgi:DNA (cytosine-5)-methyltransferase 1